MGRAYYVNGESMIYVKGPSGGAIAALSELGLAEGPISISFENQHEDVKVDAWGNAPPDIQYFLGTATISMALVHFDPAILSECQQLAMAGGAGTEGMLPHAGTLMGGGVALYQPGNSFLSLNIASPVQGAPYQFPAAYLMNSPSPYPLGTERSVVQLTFRATPYTEDPWNNGQGAQGAVLWTRTLAT